MTQKLKNKISYQDKPWLKHYDKGVPASIDFKEDLLTDNLDNAQFPNGMQKLLGSEEMNIYVSLASTIGLLIIGFLAAYFIYCRKILNPRAFAERIALLKEVLYGKESTLEIYSHCGYTALQFCNTYFTWFEVRVIFQKT